jgi:hypothetical protein
MYGLDNECRNENAAKISTTCEHASSDRPILLTINTWIEVSMGINKRIAQVAAPAKKKHVPK